MDPVRRSARSRSCIGGRHRARSNQHAGVHVKDTDPVNPPNPVMITGNVPVTPLATVMAAAVTEKSHAGPVSGTVVTLPPVCVIVRVPGNRTWCGSGNRAERDHDHARRSTRSNHDREYASIAVGFCK